MLPGHGLYSTLHSSNVCRYSFASVHCSIQLFTILVGTLKLPGVLGLIQTSLTITAIFRTAGVEEHWICAAGYPEKVARLPRECV